MSQSTLQISYTEIKTEVGRYLGLNRTVGNWDADELADVVAIIKRGVGQFYFPPRTDPQALAHRWTFLRPKATLTIWDDFVAADAITATGAAFATPITTLTASAAIFYPTSEEKTITFVTTGNTYVIDAYTSSTVCNVTGDASAETGVITIDSEDTFTLPWDYGGMAADGQFTYDVDSSSFVRIGLTSESKIRRLREESVSTSTPYLAAIVPLTTGATQAQRWTAMFYPPPNDIIELEYRYHILPNALVDTTLEYPYGSAAHSETLLESCLAIAEVREKDSSEVTHQNRFAVLLQSSIDHDRTLGEPIIHYGYNGDGSDGPSDGNGNGSNPYSNFNGLTTFNGA